MPTLAIPAGAVDTGVTLGDITQIRYVDWNTTYWIARTGTQWTAYFATPAPPGGGNLAYDAVPPSPNVLSVLTIPAGAVDTGVLNGNFSSIRYVDWNTTVWPSLKTGSHFTFSFGTPAPPGGGHVGYIGAPVGVTLGEYLNRLRRLLHDAEADFWTTPDLISDINAAIQQRDMWSGGMRSYRSNVPTTVGLDVYSLAALFSDVTVLDVINVWLVWGQQRVSLFQLPFTDLTNWFRQNILFRNRPGAWCRYGADQVYIATAPSVAYTTDWDLVVLSGALVALGDTDPLAYPYTEPVVYYAAHEACINTRRWDLADRFLGMWEKAKRDIEGSRVGEMLSVNLGRSGWS
jgi:hypothetical protein